MRPLYLLAAAALAATSLTATSALADVTGERSNVDQGILVHTNGAQTGTIVTGTLGSGPKAPAIVQFDGTTTDSDQVHLQQGNGQAELSGAVFGGPQDTFPLENGDIYLNDGNPDNLGMSWIELAFTGVTDTADTITFTLTLLGEPDAIFTLDVDHSPSGENKYAFLASNGESILNLHYNIDGGTAATIRQVRIIPSEGPGSSVPEPATWAMMLLGFGAAGVAMRRSRRKGVVSQLA
jgi:hypothetical protein